jgi:haloalkane dehalogenase
VADALRTPDERFAGLPDFPFQARYRDVAGLRLAHLDEGEGPPVVLFHGEPTWSFLWRKVIPPLRDAGFRCIVPDLVGFGRSDKPTDVGWYSYDRHVALAASLLEDLDLRDATLVLHDWGGAIGLRIAVERAERVTRLALMDTGIWTGRQRMSDAWWKFRDFVERTEDVPIGLLVRRACHQDPGDEVIAGYEAPFPTPESKAGARAFPLLIPHQPDAPGAAEGRATLEAISADPPPMLVLWADADPVLPLETGERVAAALGHDGIDHVVAGAGHFLQEDRGEEVGATIADWLRA